MFASSDMPFISLTQSISRKIGHSRKNTMWTIAKSKTPLQHTITIDI